MRSMEHWKHSETELFHFHLFSFLTQGYVSTKMNAENI